MVFFSLSPFFQEIKWDYYDCCILTEFLLFVDQASMAVGYITTSATAAASEAADFTLPLDNTDDAITCPQVSSKDDKAKGGIDLSSKDAVNLFVFIYPRSFILVLIYIWVVIEIHLYGSSNEIDLIAMRLCFHSSFLYDHFLELIDLISKWLLF